MNITDFHATSMAKVYASVQTLARNYGMLAREGELIGLIPQEAYEANAEWVRAIPDFEAESKVLERRLEYPLPWPKA